jgi:hypothetical protein
MKQIFKEKYAHLPAFNIVFYEGLEAGPEETKFFLEFDKQVENGLKNANWFWGPSAPELFKTAFGREKIFRTLNGIKILKEFHEEAPISGVDKEELK